MQAVDRSRSAGRGGSIGLVLVVAVALVGAAVGLLTLGRGLADTYILGLLAFLATVGVGLTSQYLEQAGRKLLGGLLGKVGGGLLRGVGKQAVSSGMSFATTYALGHVAKRYYAGGRTLSTQMLKDTFANVTQEAQGLQSRYLPAMQDKARTPDAGKILSMVRGA